MADKRSCVNALAFVGNEGEAAKLLAGAGPGGAVASHDLDALAAVRREGGEAVSLWRYMDGGAARGILDEAWAMCERVGAALAGRALCGAADVAACCRYDLVHAFTFLLSARHMIARCMEERGPETVVARGDCARAIHWDPPAYPTDILHAVAAHEAGLRGTPVRLLTVADARADAPRRIRPALSSAPRLPRQVDVLNICWGLGRDERAPLTAALGGRDGGRALTVADGPEEATGPHVRIESLEGLPLETAATFAAIDALETEGFPSGVASPQTPIAGLLESPALRFVWSSFCGWMRDAATWYRLGEFLAAACRPRVAVVGYEATGRVRALVRALRENGVETLSIHHSGFSFGTTRRRHRGCEGHLAVAGDVERESIASARGSPERIHAIGSLRVTSNGGGAAASAEAARVVLLTTKVADIHVPLSDPGALEETWRELAEFARSEPTRRFLIKRHPRYDYACFYEPFLAPSGARLELFEGSTSEALQGAEAAVLVAYGGSVALEATRRGIPVLFLDTVRWFERDGDAEKGAALVVRSVAEMAACLRRLREDPAFRRETVESQQAFYRRWFAAEEGEAVRRVTGLIGKLAGAGLLKPRGGALESWLLDVVMNVESGLCGALAGREFRRALSSIAPPLVGANGRPASALRAGDVGRHLLHLVAWEPWPADRRVSLPGALLAVYRALPPALRPGLRSLGAHLASACALEADNLAFARCRRLGYRLASRILAPRAAGG
jgi:hypothetical protein